MTAFSFSVMQTARIGLSPHQQLLYIPKMAPDAVNRSRLACRPLFPELSRLDGQKVAAIALLGHKLGQIPVTDLAVAVADYPRFSYQIQKQLQSASFFNYRVPPVTDSPALEFQIFFDLPVLASKVRDLLELNAISTELADQFCHNLKLHTLRGLASATREWMENVYSEISSYQNNLAPYVDVALSGEVTMDVAFTGIPLHGLSRLSVPVQDFVRHKLLIINHYLRPIGLPLIYLDDFAWIHEEQDEEWTLLNAFFAQHSDTSNVSEALFEDAIVELPINHIETLADYQSYGRIMTIRNRVRRTWSRVCNTANRPKRKIAEPSALSPLETDVLAWCRSVDHACPSTRLEMPSDYIVMYRTPLIFDEHESIEDIVEYLYSNYMERCDEDEPCPLPATHPLVTLTEKTRRFALGAHLLYQLVELLSEGTL